jgi:hypothetical protein
MTNKIPMTNDQRKPPLWSLGFGHWSFVEHWGLVIVVFFVMLYWTWLGWNDPIVDFGRELYVPWQITQGKVLYRDIAYFNGPLSPYFNALVFTILGVSLRSIVIANLMLLALLVAMIWKLFKDACDATTATVVCIVMLTIFSFIQLGGIGNYNFVTPYSHEITHGIILSVGALITLSGYSGRGKGEDSFSNVSAAIRDTGVPPVLSDLKARDSSTSHTPNTGATPVSLQRNSSSGPSPLPSPGVPGEGVAWRRLSFAGFLLGLVFLTKVEIFLAALAAVVVGALLFRRRIVDLPIVLLGACVPPVIAFLLLCSALPAHEALRGVLGSWWYVFDNRITSLLFYRKVMGTQDIGESIHDTLASSLCAMAVLGAAIAAAFTLPRRQSSILMAWILGIAISIIALLGIDLGVWQNALRWLTIAPPLIAVWMLISALRHRSREHVIRAMLAIFATVLLAKVILNVRSYHYGFALAMPATLVALAAGISWLPPIIQRRGGNPQVLRIFCICIALLLSAVHLRVYSLLYATKDVTVGSDGDRFRATLRGDRRALDLLAVLAPIDRLPPGKTLAAVPEGTMINYLSRRANPTPYITLMPPEVLMFGEDRIVRAFQQHPPDYIVMLDQSDASEYGFKGFGIDYGVEIAKWINANYSGVPFSPEPKFPIRLLRRNGS